MQLVISVKWCDLGILVWPHKQTKSCQKYERTNKKIPSRAFFEKKAATTRSHTAFSTQNAEWLRGKEGDCGARINQSVFPMSFACLKYLSVDELKMSHV